VLQTIPVYLQYCVGGLLDKDKQMINTCYEHFEKIEPTSRFAETPREYVLENLVTYFGKNEEYEKAEKIALYTLKLYPNQYPTLYNLAMIYQKTRGNNRFKNLNEAGCFFYLAVHKADDLGRKDGYLAPINYMRTTGMENLKVDCSKYDLNAMIKQVSKQVLENEKQTH